MTKFLDANIVLRYLLGDPGFEEIKNVLVREEDLYIADIVIAEVIWTFTSFYKWKKDKFIPKLRTFISPGFIKAEKKLLNRALDLYEVNNIDYIDAYTIALMEKMKVRSIYSHDKHFEALRCLVWVLGIESIAVRRNCVRLYTCLDTCSAQEDMTTENSSN